MIAQNTHEELPLDLNSLQQKLDAYAAKFSEIERKIDVLTSNFDQHKEFLAAQDDKIEVMIGRMKAYVLGDISPDFIYETAKAVALEKYGVEPFEIQDAVVPNMKDYPNCKTIGQAKKEYKKRVSTVTDMICYYLLDKLDGGALKIREAQQVTGITNVYQYSQKYKCAWGKSNEVRKMYIDFSSSVNTKVHNESVYRCSVVTEG